MKNKKFLSVLLCLALLASLPVLPGGAAVADDPADNGMKISKTATPNDDGTYTITLEAYATGSKVTTTVNKDIPTDIILVLDQSGSMADDIGQVQYTPYTGNNTQNRSNYEKRHNGGSANLWHKLPDGSYVSVSVTKTTTYKELGSLVNYETSWGSLTTDCYYYYMNNLYEKVGDEYKKVTIKVKKGGLFEKDTFIYTFSDGTTVSSKGNSSKPNFGSHAPLYTPAADGTNTVYTYTYTDSTGAVQTIGTSTGANTQFKPAFYQRSTTTSGGGSRLSALKSAATTFANAVAAKAAGADGNINTTADNVNHRIAVVGYADTDSDYGYNTGVFIGSTLNRYETAAAGVYGTALQDMNTTGGKNNVTASLNALQSSGATRTDYGLIMAQGILNANPVPEGQTRNRVVIVFTDGAPTNSNGFKRAVANSAISTANAIKAGGTTVYSIGIFSGADASTAGKEPDKDYEDSGWSANYTEAEMSAACNWFMQKISSNNGTPRTPSYYLSAGDAASLNNIFQQISNQIESGGTSSTLTSESVVKDIISPQFTLPAGATASDITLETWECTGKEGDAYTWSKNTDAMGAQATIASTDNTHATTTNNQVSVTGFNFSENYVGTVTENGQVTGYRGNKLVIKFNVKPRDGFLGGNGVYTNTSAGIYENADAKDPLLEFEKPNTDITIKEPTITLPDANVYLGAYFDETVSADDLKNGTSISFDNGKITLDLSKADDTEKPWGLEPWQTEYVDITVTVKDKDGNTVTDFENLREDTDYTVSVSIQPKTEGTQKGYDTPSSGTIHVFTPELTFKDNTVDYMASIADYDYNTNNYVSTSTRWIHKDDETDDMKVAGTEGVKMLGNQTAPVLTLVYTPTTGVKDGKVTATDYVPVKATVKIGTEDVTGYTTFVHQDCTLVNNCQWTTPAEKGDPAFLLHVINVVGDLKITKTGLNQHTYSGDKEDQESAIFKVENAEKTESWIVAINGDGFVTLTGLKVGSYTVTELDSWTWRYADQTVKTATVVGGGTVTVTFDNTHNNQKWLGGDNYANNVFGSGN